MNTGAKERPISQILAAEAYERNKEKKKIRAKDFDHIKDKEERRRAYLREYSRRYREEHPDYANRYRKGVKRNPEQMVTTDKQRQQMKQWRKEHPGYWKDYFKRRREEAKAKMEAQSKMTREDRIKEARKKLPKNVRETIEALEEAGRQKKIRAAEKDMFIL